MASGRTGSASGSSSVLDQLPSGPRIALFEIPGVLHRSLIRAEDDTLLIGGEPASTVTFVAVVGPEVARTESGHPGRLDARRARARARAAGRRADRAHDPRLVVPERAAQRADRDRRRSDRRDRRRAADRGRRLARTAMPAPAPAPRVRGPRRPRRRDSASCLTSSRRAVRGRRDDIAVRSAESERAIATLRIAGADRVRRAAARSTEAATSWS